MTNVMPDDLMEGRPLRLSYLPFDQIEAGMVLGEPVTLTDHHVVRFSLPAGHALTEGNLRNLASHRTAYLCIATPDTRSVEEIAADAAAATARVTRIFEGADLTQPATAALFDRVCAFRSL